MVRRLAILLVLTTVISAALAAVVTAGSGPRLNGKFNVVATVKDNDFGVADGTKTNDTYTFKSSCESGGCAKVKLDRAGGANVNKHYKSTLKKDSGVYKGTEGPYAYDCPGTDDATFTAKHTIEVSKARNGKARKVEGKTNITIKNCSFGSFVNYTLKGDLSN